MCYDHNKCKFQYYICLLSKPLTKYSSQKKPELNQTKKHTIIFVLIICTESCICYDRNTDDFKPASNLISMKKLEKISETKIYRFNGWKKWRRKYQ